MSSNKMKKKIKKRIKEILILIIFSIIIGCFRYFDIDNSNIVSTDMQNIPEYSGNPYIKINNNIPSFTESDYTTDAFEIYDELDKYGRCGVAYANICKEIMPQKDEEREAISFIIPSGWEQTAYEDIVEGDYLYNRCHLIGHQLAGENANKRNLITGTRYMNVEGMLPFENDIADYIEENENNHVLYRVTPIFEGNNLVASGVHLEAYSVEDSGEGICVNVFFYNVQDGVIIDYATGENKLANPPVEDSGGNDDAFGDDVNNGEGGDSGNDNAGGENGGDSSGNEQEQTTYILNTNSKKIHYPDCPSVGKMSDKNKAEYTGSVSDKLAEGYTTCGTCNPK